MTPVMALAHPNPVLNEQRLAARSSSYTEAFGFPNMDYVGEIAGLAPSFFIAFTSLIFASAGRMVGSQVTNRIRLIFALVYLVLANILLFGEPLPLSAEPSRWIWLAFSGMS